MTEHPTAAERLDRAVDAILDGMQPPVAAASAGVDRGGRPLVDLASALRLALEPPPLAARFEGRLGVRLATAATSRQDSLARALRHPGRLIVTGAVGSAVGVGVTAFAVWRTTRRAGSHRLLHR